MSEQANPKASKRSKRKPMEPLGWDEIVSQPGMGGYLSFLNGPVALPHLTAAAPAAEPNPGVDPDTENDINPAVAAASGHSLATEHLTTPAPISGSAVETTPGLVSVSGHEVTPEVERTSAVEAAYPILHDAAAASTPVVGTHSVLQATPDSPRAKSRSRSAVSVVESDPVVLTYPRRPRIRRCLAAHDGHSLGEEVLYQALWKASQPESDDTRTITIGWRGMSQLCRMTPKNCKINTQRLLKKLALEILSPYNTPESIGTTYRVFSSEAILRRRHDAGFEWVIRSRGVEFVNPATGAAMPMCAVTY